MGHDTNAGRVGRCGNSGRGGRGRGGCGRGASATMPRNASEVGACKDLEGHIFTIGSGNKGKDGDMLRTSMEKMATYIGTKYGNEAAQEWTSGKKITLSEPAYSQAIWDRHAARVKATREQIELRLKSLRAEKTAIEAEINSAPTDCGLLKELREVDNQIARGDIKLNDSMMRLKWNSQMMRRQLTATRGEPPKRQLWASRKAGGKYTLCYLASALKCWLTRWNKTWIGWPLVSHLTRSYSLSSSKSLSWSNPTINTRRRCLSYRSFNSVKMVN